MEATLTRPTTAAEERAEVALLDYQFHDPIEELGDQQPETRPALRPLFKLDAGWFFMIAGVGILAATILIPAQHDLALSRWQRDRALAIEHHRMDRLERYGSYLAAVDKGDETVLLSLTATQLNKSPADRIPLDVRPDPGLTSASVFPDLEPDAIKLPTRPAINERSSMLTRWTINDHTRLWLLAAGMLCVMIGVLPPSVRK